MFHLLPLLATVLTPLLLAAGGRAAPAADPHGDNGIEHAAERGAEAVAVADHEAARAIEHGAADLARDVLRHEPVVRKRGPGVIEVSIERRDVAAPATNVRLAREKRWGGGGGGGGGWGQRGGCCAGCPGSRGW
jgi:hypothetical protein